MNDQGQSIGHVEEASRDVLTKLGNIADKAIAQLDESKPVGATTLATVNTFNDGGAVNAIGKAATAVRESAFTLKNEPALARVLVEDRDGKQDTFYICRVTPIDGIRNLASYDSPVGRLAALRPGSEFTFPNGRAVEVLERFLIYPKRDTQGWDSQDTVVELESAAPRTYRSLRRLLANYLNEDEEDVIAQLLAQDNASGNVIEGTRRKMITRMALRDQPILDEFQDEIFRLPLASSLLLLGPPGTGKTTTLIKRLAQKIKLENLSSAETLSVNPTVMSGISHASSWVMFTPTELLKLYLKEGFARQNVGASARHLQTWEQYRHDIGRNVLPILRSNTTSGGIFSLRADANVLLATTQDDCLKWFEDFDAWQHQAFLSQLREAADKLQASDDHSARSIARPYVDTLFSAERRGLGNLLMALIEPSDTLAAFISSLRKATEDAIRKSLIAQYKRSPTLLRDLAEFVATLSTPSENDGLEDTDAEGEEEDEVVTPKTDTETAVTAYTQAVRSLARSTASKRTLPRQSRSGRIIEWLSAQEVDFGDLQTIGQQLLTLRDARRINQPVRRYFNDLPKRYRLFRRQRQGEGRWYSEIVDAREIVTFEIDLILLALLKAGQSAVDRSNLAYTLDLPGWSALRTISSLWRNQILVDEATDFSPIQLRCMANLCHPNLKSFFACGDFNQRLTQWGTKTADEIHWVSGDIETRNVIIGYRQSQQLNSLARALIEGRGDSPPDLILPDHIDSGGAAPILFENARTAAGCVTWLADRICEIERTLGQLPAIAVFVNTEGEVDPLADALQEMLSPYHINVTAAVRGEILGQPEDIRVFDIRHIKGLEFEAAFFIGIDELADLHPQLIDKYLYVGVTRAASYLGLTSYGSIPALLEPLRLHFKSNWI